MMVAATTANTSASTHSRALDFLGLSVFAFFLKMWMLFMINSFIMLDFRVDRLLQALKKITLHFFNHRVRRDWSAESTEIFLAWFVNPSLPLRTTKYTPPREGIAYWLCLSVC